MKETIISNLYESQLMAATAELFEFIELTYAIGQADQRFLSFFVKVLKENYSHLSFEQIESAFERNSLGLLDIYLSKIGQRPDNKIKSFNIPDLSKIINAFLKYKNIEKEETIDKIVFSEKQKAKSNIWWCDFIQGAFDKYKGTKERTKIDCSMFAAEKFAEFGLLDKKEIVYETVTLKFNNSHISTKNENLIYEAFDALILQNEGLAPYLVEQRNKYQVEETPF